jgi:2-C-methyl-D-erythritol 4-phosphate cytidylyltransferase
VSNTVDTAASAHTVNYWAVIPAAGSGKRMASTIPKQYLTVRGRSVLEWALLPFLSDHRCLGVVVSIAVDDEHWPRLFLQHTKLHAVSGGVERADSVLAGLNALLTNSDLAANQNDWVMVHDAARPCLHHADLDALLAVTRDSESVGALLATPLADTLKQANADQRVAQTLPRAGLWRALTPQMFRLGELRDALQRALASGVMVTDESSAMEAAGHQPCLIAGRSDNLKITLPEDLPLAESILAAREIQLAATVTREQT